jgi:hypothetical protein
LRRAVQELAATSRVDEALRLADEVLATSDDPMARAEVTLTATWLQMYTPGAQAAADAAVAEAALIEASAPQLASQLRIAAALSHLASRPLQECLVLASNPAEAEVDVANLGLTLESACPPALLALVGRVNEASSWLPPERVRFCADLVRLGEISLPVVAGAQGVALSLVWLERPTEAAMMTRAMIDRLSGKGVGTRPQPASARPKSWPSRPASRAVWPSPERSTPDSTVYEAI